MQAVYGVLKEAEHRSTFYFPYWDIPGASVVVPRQRAFNADLAVINDCLDDLISQAEATKQDQDLESLQNRDYSKVSKVCTNMFCRVRISGALYHFYGRALYPELSLVTSITSISSQYFCFHKPDLVKPFGVLSLRCLIHHC